MTRIILIIVSSYDLYNNITKIYLLQYLIFSEKNYYFCLKGLGFNVNMSII